MLKLAQDFLILMCVALAVSGCASDRLSKKELDLLASREKGVVVLNCRAVVLISDPSTWFGGPKKPYNFSCNTIWRHSSLGEEFVQEGEGTIYSRMVYSITPGVYNLTGIHVPEAAGYSYSVHNLTNIAKFEVKGGDVVYLGDVILNIHQSAIIAKALEVEDKYQDAEKLMAKSNPQLASYLSTKLITLSEMVDAIKKTNLIINSVPSSQR